VSAEDDESGSSAVVDFDALHAALGAVAPAPSSSGDAVSDSEGRSSATYASARPHAIPKGHASHDDPNTPAVIVLADDTVQTGPPIMMGAGRLGRPISSGPLPVAPSRTDPPVQVRTEPFPAMAQAQAFVDPKLTLRMAERPRKRHTVTVALPSRGPTNQQKFMVFVAMLVVVVAGGISALVYYEPAVLNAFHGGAQRAPGITTVAPRAAAPPFAATAPVVATAATAAPGPSSVVPTASTRRVRPGPTPAPTTGH
jgi:hypothetical protein